MGCRKIVTPRLYAEDEDNNYLGTFNPNDYVTVTTKIGIVLSGIIVDISDICFEIQDANYEIINILYSDISSIF